MRRRGPRSADRLRYVKDDMPTGDYSDIMTVTTEP